MSENRIEQNIWNIIFTGFYLVLFAGGLYLVMRIHGELPISINFFDLALIILATFRLIRLFVYDKVTRWFRDIFDGAHRGPQKTISDLLGCPWCLGLWMGTLVLFFYLLIPAIAWFFILVLAVAGVASLIQLFANMLGWSAQNGKLAAQKADRDLNG